MLFSSKISSSIIAYIDHAGLNRERLDSVTDVPEEFLRNPSSWMDASRLESFLQEVEKTYGPIFEEVGHKSPELRAWGVLDGVLRMMPSPHDLFGQPDRILSYFISPAPVVRNLVKSIDSVSFDTTISSLEFPLIVKYLVAAFESLPMYMGKGLAHISWVGHHVEIALHEKQPGLFGEQGPGQQLNPEFLQNLIHQLESGQKQLEEKNRQLVQKNNELLIAQKELKSQFYEKVNSEKLTNLGEIAAGLQHEVNNPLAYVMSNLLRLSDYFARAQQLVTILVGRDRQSPQVREAMRRMDWEYIVTEYGTVVKEATEGLQRVRDIVKDLSYLAGPVSASNENKEPARLDILVANAVKVAKSQGPQGIKFQLELDFIDEIPVFPTRMEQALVNLLNNAVQAVGTNGLIKVKSQQVGEQVSVVVEDNGHGMDEKTLESIFTPYFTTKSSGHGTGLGLSIVNSIVQMHGGEIKVESAKGQGSKFSIQLPIIENIKGDHHV